MGCRPTGCALAAPPPVDGNHIVADTDAKKRTILLDAKRRPLQARVGRRAVMSLGLDSICWFLQHSDDTSNGGETRAEIHNYEWKAWFTHDSDLCQTIPVFLC